MMVNDGVCPMNKENDIAGDYFAPSKRATTRKRQRVGRVEVENSAYLQALFDQSALGILYLDAENHCIQSNQRISDIVGYTQQELLTLPFQHLIVHEDLPQWQESIQKTQAADIGTGDPAARNVELDLCLLCKDTHTVHVHIDLSATAIASSQEHPQHVWIGFVHKIADAQITSSVKRSRETESEIGVEALRLPEHTASQVASRTSIYPVSGHHASPINQTVSVSSAESQSEPQSEPRTQQAVQSLLKMAETLMKLPAATEEFESVGLELAQLVKSVLDCQRVGMYTIEPATQFLRPLAVVGLSEEQEHKWWQMRSKHRLSLQQLLPQASVEALQDNKVIIINQNYPGFVQFAQPFPVQTIIIAPVCLGEKMTGVIAIDYGSNRLTYRKDEFALMEAVARLCALVIDRQQLMDERAEAQGHVVALREANSRMEEFLSIASHELRTPLTTIKANTQLAMRRLRSMHQQPEALPTTTVARIDAAYDMLTRAERQVGVLNRLVGDLIDISRIQSGRLQIHLKQEPCDLLQIVRECVFEQRKATPERIIGMSLPDVDQAPVMVDADRIGQVLTNYLTNALKYSEAVKPVEVTVELEHEHGFHVKVSVQDWGPGLSVEEQESIWNCFYRSQRIKVLSGSGVGLGLGLYISKTLIERHNGQAGVTSKMGVGSIFWFTLPLAQTEETSAMQ